MQPYLISDMKNSLKTLLKDIGPSCRIVHRISLEGHPIKTAEPNAHDIFTFRTRVLRAVYISNGIFTQRPASGDDGLCLESRPPRQGLLPVDRPQGI